jgi:hypothetical protein
MLLVPALLALTLSAPDFRVDGGLPPEAEEEAARAWASIAAVLSTEGVAVPASPRPIRIVPAAGLAAAEAARSRPGAIAVRPGLAGFPRSGPGALALRHEVAHQLLFEACPAASGDALFHEAFAVATSGELAAWVAGEEGRPYLPLSHALQTLDQAPSLDAPAARRALARLLAESPALPGRLPPALARPMARCEAGATWLPLSPRELAGELPAADALVILSRHTGEVLTAEGAARAPLPFGSTLKPFVIAGAAGAASAGRAPPALRPDLSRPVWRCGQPRSAATMDADTALLRSCNGWFLDWAARDPEVIRLGAWGPALLALGLSALPADPAEAIGIRPALRISPLGLAQAYRLLAEARPDVMAVLARNAREGTLSGLPASDALAGVAVKTGTVLDAAARPRLGLIAAVDADLVLVMVREGKIPRAIAAEAAAALGRARRPAREAARVQVLGLLDPEDVTGRCAGRGYAAAREGPVPAPEDFAPVAALARRGPLVCLGGPWLLRYPQLEAARPYAGVLTRQPLADAPSGPPGPGPAPTARERRARAGSELVLRTTRLAYAAGVVDAEDARLRGEARIALARIVDANGRDRSRHPGRPPCDTTHCQAFRGTAAPRPEDRAALRDPLAARGWLPFSQGGRAPWTAERRAAEVERALGRGAQDLRFGGGRVEFLAAPAGQDAAGLEGTSLPCERLRGPLKLPSCPDRATALGDRFRFEGHGEGHGVGLDVEWARRSGLTAGEILQRAYPGVLSGGER